MPRLGSVPLSRFLSSLAFFSARNLPALFQTGNALEVSPSELSPPKEAVFLSESSTLLPVGFQAFQAHGLKPPGLLASELCSSLSVRSSTARFYPAAGSRCSLGLFCLLEFSPSEVMDKASPVLLSRPWNTAAAFPRATTSPRTFLFRRKPAIDSRRFRPGQNESLPG